MLGASDHILSTVPDHVPPDLVVDFDMTESDPAGGDPHRYWHRRARVGRPPIFWTPRNGGHWVLTRLDDLNASQADHSTFSNKEFVIPRGIVPRLVPVNLDPPAHTAFRKLMMPFFVPRALAEIDAKARSAAARLAGALQPLGRCEFVVDFAGTMPVVAFLAMMRLPEEDLPMLRAWGTLASRPHHPDSPGAWASLSDYIRRWIAERRVRPVDDPLSAAIHGEVDGRPLSDDDVFSMSLLLLTGGLDTVASMLSFVAHFLATHPVHRRQLLESPSLIPNAVQEFARRFGVSNLGRLVTVDTEFAGVRMRKGDMVLLPMALGGLDDDATADPWEVDFERSQPRHTAWGTGVHACPGRVLSQHEMAIFLEEWLPRIPDFTLDDRRPPLFSTGLINSVETLHLRWS